MRRELRTVRGDHLRGAVDDSLRSPFVGQAADALRGLRGEVGDNRAVEIVLAEGWSNGYLYFAEPVATT